MSKIYLVIKAEGEWEEYHITPIEAWLSKEKAEEAIKEYEKEKDVLLEEDWNRLCEEVDSYEEMTDTRFPGYIEGILSLHRDWDTPEFREKLENTKELYYRLWEPSYYLETIELKG